MRLHKATPEHLLIAAMNLSPSDRLEMDLIEAGRDPVDVLLAAAKDPTIRAISTPEGDLLAVGGHSQNVIWFVHTTQADALSLQARMRMLSLLTGHLRSIKGRAQKRFPHALYHFTNVVSDANRKHMRLLKALGAHFGSTHRINGHEFHQFYF